MLSPIYDKERLKYPYYEFLSERFRLRAGEITYGAWRGVRPDLLPWSHLGADAKPYDLDARVNGSVFGGCAYLIHYALGPEAQLRVRDCEVRVLFCCPRPDCSLGTNHTIQLDFAWIAALTLGLSFEAWVGLIEQRMETSHLCGNYDCIDGTFASKTVSQIMLTCCRYTPGD